MAIPITLYETDGFSPAEAVVLKLWQGNGSVQTFYLKESDGVAYAMSPAATVSMLVTETWAATPAAQYFTVDGIVEVAADGKVSFDIPASKLIWPGLFLGEVTVTVAGSVAKRFRIYVEVTQTLTQQQSTNPLTIAQIRAAIRDRCAEDNFLLDRVEFQDGDIVWAIQRPVDWWNETAPQGVKTYSYATFPYKHHWTDAVIGELLRMAGLQLSRNRIQLNGGGITTDDKERAAVYLNVGDKLIKEFKSWGVSRMSRENMENWNGWVKSGYF